MDQQGKYHACDLCDALMPDEWHNCDACGAWHRAPTEEEEAAHERAAWDEDERDMQRIANEWAAYDRDPPGS